MVFGSRFDGLIFKVFGDDLEFLKEPFFFQDGVTRVTGPPSPKQKNSEILVRVTRAQKISLLTSIG